jgi:hypothetical protein
LAGFDLRDVEHIVDQAQQMFAILLDALQNFQRLVRRRAVDAIREQLGKAEDIGEELALVLIRDGQLRTREATVVRGIGVLPVFAGLIGLLLLVGALAATGSADCTRGS